MYDLGNKANLPKRAMALQHRDRIASSLPELRRFAGALIAPGSTHSTGGVDDIVVRAAVAVCRETPSSEVDLRLALYAAVIRLAQSREARPAPAASGSLADGLLSLQFQHRAALLLVTLERLSYDEAAIVIGVSRTFLAAKVSTARQILARRMESCREARAVHLKVVK